MASSRISSGGHADARVVHRQGGGQGELHLHSPGEGLDEVFPGQAEFVQIVPVQPIVPGGIDGGQDALQVPGPQRVVEHTLIQNHAHAGLGRPLLTQVVPPQKGDLPRVPADQVQDALDGGGFSCPVFPDQPHDGAAGESEVDILEGEVRIGLAQPLDLNAIRHNSSP